MKEEFRFLVVEPFGNKGFGKGEDPWALFLDWLDECEGVDEQLISEFVLNFPDTSLVWVIVICPELYTVATFKNEAVARSHWSMPQVGSILSRLMNLSVLATKLSYFLPVCGTCVTSFTST